MRRKCLRLVSFIALYLSLSLIVVTTLLPLVLQYYPVQELILEEILEHYHLSNVRISFSKAKVILWNPVEVRAEDVELRLAWKSEPIKIAQVSAKLFLKDMLKGRFFPYALVLSGVNIVASSASQVQRPLMRSPKELIIVLGAIFKLNNFSLLGGTLRLPSRSLTIRDISVRVRKEKDEQSSGLYASATLERHGQVAPLILRGKAQIVRPAITPSIHVKISAARFPFLLVGQTGCFVPKQGEFRANVQIDYSNKGITYHAHLRGYNPVFVIQKTKRDKLFQFPSLEVYLSGLYRAKTLEISQFEVKGPSFLLEGNLRYSPHPKSDKIHLTISSMWMNYATFRQLFPDPLVNPWVSNTLFPIISKGMVKVEEFTLKGSREQIAHLEQPSNRSCLCLKIFWKELEALSSCGPFPFDHVSGSISISDGSLNMSHLKGNYGGSVVSDGSVLVSDLYGKVDQIYIQTEAQMNLSELKKLAQCRYVAGRLPPLLEAIDDVHGIAPLKIQGRWFSDEDRFVMDTGFFGPVNCRFSYNGIDVELQRATVQFKKGLGYTILQGEMALGKASFHVSGWSDDEFDTLCVHANGKAKLGHLLGFVKVSSYLKISSPEPTKIAFSIKKNPNSLAIDCNLEMNEVTIKAGTCFGLKGYKGDSLFVRVKRGLDTKDMEGEAILFQKRGFIAGSFRYVKKLDLVQANIITPKGLGKNIELFLGPNPYRIEGVFACDLKIKMAASNPGDINVFGKLQGYGLRLRNKGRPTLFKDCQIGIEFKGKDIFINCMRAEPSSSPVIVSGHLKGWNRFAGKLRIEVEKLDLASIFHALYKNISLGENFLLIGPRKTDIKVQLNVKSSYYRSLSLGSLKARLAIRGGNLYIEDCQISSAHSSMALVGYLNAYPKLNYYLGIYVKAHDFPVQDVFEAVAINKPTMEGSLDMEALLSSQGEQFKSLIRNLNGQANFIIKKGKIHKSSLLIKLLDFFSVQKIFIKEPPHLSKEGFYFKDIKGSLDVNKGVVHTDEVVMKSPVFNAIVRGKVNLNSGEIKADLGAQPFVTIDSILSRVPVVGYILTGKERALLVYYFKIRGTIAQPKLSYVPLKNIGRGVLLFFRRAFLTPVRLFKNIGKFAVELSKQGRPVPSSKFETPGY